MGDTKGLHYKSGSRQIHKNACINTLGMTLRVVSRHAATIAYNIYYKKLIFIVDCIAPPPFNIKN